MSLPERASGMRSARADWQTIGSGYDIAATMARGTLPPWSLVGCAAWVDVWELEWVVRCRRYPNNRSHHADEPAQCICGGALTSLKDISHERG